MHKILAAAFLALFLAPPPAQYGFRVVKTYPHDRNAFTQGLEYRDGFLYEGTGLVGRSALRKDLQPQKTCSHWLMSHDCAMLCIQ